MSWNEGDGPDPTEVNGPTNPAAEGDYLSAAANWLAMAEESVSGSEERRPELLAFSFSARLAELNIALATACGTYQSRQPQRYAIDTTAMRDALAEKIAADAAAHDAVRLTGSDPEPESSDGDLWIDDENPRKNFPFLYKLGAGRWTWANNYAEVLRGRGTGEPWATCLYGGYVVRRPTQEEREAFYGPPEKRDDTPPAETSCDCCASGLFSASAVHDEICGDCGHAGGRHNGNAPTPPEPACTRFEGVDPVKANDLCNRCGASAQAHVSQLNKLSDEDVSPIPVRHVQAEPEVADLWAFVTREGVALAELDGDQMTTMRDTLQAEIVRRAKEPRRGGHEAWRG